MAQRVNWTKESTNATNWTKETLNPTNWSPGGAPTAFLLQQNSDYILQQNGDYIGLQQA